MKNFEYEIKVSAETQLEADKKVQCLITILKKLNTQELVKISEVVSNPIQLALVKSKLM